MLPVEFVPDVAPGVVGGRGDELEEMTRNRDFVCARYAVVRTATPET